ncbi:MAG: 23S rRNA (pseudouridine(1915)-N(3))-methyltransferase RlmH [Lachnospiraceae bacterium]|nr:23S rRNA (pseudouridine(1915)-N(3))-methyltransferase RlmH [Lachnospiraceae bacterium]
MDIKLIAVGKVKEEYFRNKIDELKDKINARHRYNINIIEVPDESIPEKQSETVLENIKNKEGKKILSKIEKKDYVVALCIDGKSTDDSKLFELIKRAESDYKTSFVLVIGGSLGLSDEVIKRADYKLSISGMTFPHQLMRVVILEILYNIFL